MIGARNYKVRHCEICNREMKRFRITKKNQIVCWRCYSRGLKGKLMPFSDPTSPPKIRITLKEALKREYTPRLYLLKNKKREYGICSLSLPQVLAGYKIKIRLVKKKKEKKK